MFEEVTKLFSDFNCNPEEFERQQKIIKNMKSWADNPIKFLEENTGLKFRWYQKVWIIISSKFRYKNMKRTVAKNAIVWGLYRGFDFHRGVGQSNQDSGERKHPDAITGLVPCGCGGKPIFERTGNEQYPVMAQCSECYVRTDDMADEYWAKERWNKSQGHIEEDKDYD